MSMSKRIGSALALALVLGIAIDRWPAVSARQQATNAARAGASARRGQSATQLSDGRWLLLGGEGSSGTLATGAILDPRTGVAAPIAGTLAVSRAGHTATVLPDGSVLIVGGHSDGASVPIVELFDPLTQTFTGWPVKGSVPRAAHTTTLLSDGRLLVVGGTVGMSPAPMEIWDLESHTAEAVPGVIDRSGHVATLLADGRVLVTGGRSTNGRAQPPPLMIDPVTMTAVTGEPPVPPDTAPTVVFTAPASGDTGVPLTTRLVVRFSESLPIETIGDRTLRLTGPQGVVATKAVGAEGGILAFVWPLDALIEGTTYTLTIDTLANSRGIAMTPATVTFTTVEATRTGDVPDEETWLPDGKRSGWRSGRPASPWESLAPLTAPPGVTAVSGRVLRLDGRPLADVTLEIDERTAHTDRTGRFLLLVDGLATAEHTLEIDARSANKPGRTYGFYEARIGVRGGLTNVLPFTIWSPLIDTAHQVTIPSPTITETVITTPTMPGLELHLPAGTVITDEDGAAVRTVSLTPIPLDRTPFPMPEEATFTMFFTIQPGGAYLATPGPIKGGWLVYPRNGDSPVGKRVRFFNYDPDDKGWFAYGLGTVTPTAVVPDATTRLYGFTGASFNDGNEPPPNGPTQGGKRSGDPVDPSTGTFVLEKTDLVVEDVMPITLTRTYDSWDTDPTSPRPFGIGMSHPYAVFLHMMDVGAFAEADLIQADGGRTHFVKTAESGGTWNTTIFEHTATPTAFYKSRLSFWGAIIGYGGWQVARKDGTVYVFGHAAPLAAIRDQYGNEIRLTWSGTNFFGAGTGNITRITSPHGRWIAFTYDASNRITQAQDNIGRTVTYTYDAGGHLSTVTDPENNVTTYTWDASHRLITVKDGRNIVYLTNEYTSGRVTKQTLADPASTYTYAYSTDQSGAITQTDVTDPRQHTERLVFNPATHYVTSDIEALNTPQQRTTTFERQTGGNFPSAVLDDVLVEGQRRRTEYTYDTTGHVLTVKRLAGTTAAATTTFTYEPKYFQLATVTDPLNHTSTLTYDSAGRLTGTTDPLTHHTVIDVNAAGQVTRVVDPLTHAWQFAYNGADLTSTTDPLARVSTRFVDAAGRILRTTDPAGRSTATAVDKLNRVASVTDPLGGQTTFSYDPNSNLLSLTDALNHAASYTYDLNDRVATRTDPLSTVVRYTYDAVGNATQTVDRIGQTTSRQYDALNRLTQITYADQSTITYAYDAGDRLTQIVDSANGTITRTYDGADRVTQETTPQGDVSYTYDAAGRRDTMIVTGQPTVGYGYDNANQLISITQGSNVVALNYDDGGRRTTLTYPNGIVATYGYDDANQVTSLNYTVGQTTLGNLTYTYDAAGNRASVGGNWARTGLPQPIATATVDAANRLLTWGAQSFSYDLNGNLASNGLTSYTWNARNQLVGLGGGTSASFVYDGLSRRRSKTISGTTISFLYDNANIVQELTGTAPIANLLTGLDIDETFTRSDAAGTSTRLVDALGSALALADTSGTVQTQYTFDPFGSTSTSGAASTNAFQFAGRETDATGLYFSRMRFYDPGLQRFVSEDPIGPLGGLNLYGYVNNSPTNETDRLGLAPDSWFECWANCIERRRFELPFPLISAWPKQLLPPFRVVDQADRLTTPLSSLMYLMKDILPEDLRLYLRHEAGRSLSYVGTPLTLGEGFWDWYVIIDCAKKCRDCR